MNIQPDLHGDPWLKQLSVVQTDQMVDVFLVRTMICDRHRNDIFKCHTCMKARCYNNLQRLRPFIESSTSYIYGPLPVVCTSNPIYRMLEIHSNPRLRKSPVITHGYGLNWVNFVAPRNRWTPTSPPSVVATLRLGMSWDPPSRSCERAFCRTTATGFWTKKQGKFEEMVTEMDKFQG